jgi:ferredoxin-NADP reductase
LQLGWVSKPDVALLIGNMFSFLIGQRRAIKLTFVSSVEIAPMIYSVTLKPVRPIRFTAGQYIELTLPHTQADYRGVRRMFSIASQPDDEYIKLGLVTARPSSSFKAALLGLAPGTHIRATQVGGSFVLPKTSTGPIVMIAGGIGITPFRSMIAQLISRADKRQVTVFYAAKHETSLVYGGLLNRAREVLGTKVIPIISEPTSTWSGPKGMISYDFIDRYVDNMSGCVFYISGPNVMVSAIRRQLISGGVPGYRIKTDYFSGY